MKISSKKTIISIIIPAYNAEKSIERTLKSLINQTYPFWEALIIDNNSTDKTATIIKKYAAQDARIRYLFEKEKGPATARNKGLETASGEYIMFCDADDWYSEDMCNFMLEAIVKEDVDLVTSEPNIILQENVRYNESADFAYHKLSNFGKFEMNKTWQWLCKDTLWNKIFKKSIIDKYQIRFPINSLFDDAFFILCYCLVSNTLFCTNKKGYNYVFSNSGITFNIQHHKYSLEDLSRGFDAGIKFLIKNNLTTTEKVDLCLTKTKEILGYPLSYIYKDEDLVEIFDYLRDQFKDIDSKLLNVSPALLAISLGKYNFASVHFGRLDEKRGNFILQKQFKRYGLIEKIKVLGIKLFEKCYEPDNISYKLFGKFSIYKKRLESVSIKKEKPDNIHIFFAANNTYIKPLIVAINSLFRHARKQDSINVYIITDDIKPRNRFFLSLLRKNVRQSIEFLYIDKKRFSQMPLMEHFKQQNYYRYLIPELKPNLHKAIYLDADIVVKHSLNNLWNQNINDYYVAAVSDYGVLLDVSKNIISKKQNIIAFDGSYFNSGVMLINLDLWKTDNITKKLIENTSLIRDKILYADQCVLNYTFKEKIKYLGFEYNIQTHGNLISNEFMRQQYYIVKHIPIVIHYTCASKPFSNIASCQHELWEQWLIEAQKTIFTAHKFPFYKEIHPKKEWNYKIFNFTVLKKRIKPYVPTANFLKVRQYNFLGMKITIAPSKKKLVNTIFYCLWTVKDEVNFNIHRIKNGD